MPSKNALGADNQQERSSKKKVVRVILGLGVLVVAGFKAAMYIYYNK